MIVVSELSKAYRKDIEPVETKSSDGSSYMRTVDYFRAVQNATFSVSKGEFVLIVGRSGSGKSTLLSMLGGLTAPTEGVVRLNDKNLWSMSDEALSHLRAEYIGFVFQFSGLLPTLNVLENVMLPSLFVKAKEDPIKRARKLLLDVGLDSKIQSFPPELSGGELKRAAIARALINDPLLILADEPTGDLDVDTEKEIMALFKEINRQGKTILMVTHNPELSSYSSRVIRMEKGKISEPLFHLSSEETV
ncbi:MAG: ABC transporter ATP-binding protein [Candidatus Bathyarchaeia archaeon]